MRRTMFLGIALVACTLVLMLSAIAWAGKPESPPGKDKDEVPWGVDRIDADLAWDVNKGTGIKVAVIDTGIDIGHPDLDTARGVNFVGAECTGDGDDNYGDTHGHGTAIAGVIAALDDGKGIIGVAPEVELWAVRVREKSGIVYPDGYPDHGDTYNFTDLCEGMEWCIKNGMQVISFSLGIWTINDDDPANPEHLYPLHDCEFYALIQQAYDLGIVMVAAAGNGVEATGGAGRSIEKYESPGPADDDFPGLQFDFPASYPGVIAVAATGITETKGKPSDRLQEDYMPSFSNFGPAVELAAPGKSIKTTTPDGRYGYWSGTSLSAPHVAAAAALALRRLGADEPSPDSRDAVRTILAETADEIGIEGIGYGLVDAEEAATGAQTNPAPGRPGILPAGKLSVAWGRLKSR